MDLPKFWQWRRFFSILSLKEKGLFLLFLILAFFSGIGLLGEFYFQNTIPEPATGGIFREGMVGQPRFVNPLYVTTEDIDRDLHQLIFSGLLKYNEKAQIVPDLAKDYKIEQDGRVYEFQLRDNVFWHDGEPFSAEDVVFTVNLLQTPQYKSPLSQEWLGVRVEIEGENKVVFRLQKRYFSFLETVARLKIIPKHLFKDVEPEKMPWGVARSDYLVGTGPFAVWEVREYPSGFIKEIVLKRNEHYYNKKPYIDQFVFRFYKDSEALASAIEREEIEGGVLDRPFQRKGFNNYALSIPRYFALFFNLTDSKITNNKNIREALGFAVNKKEILEQVFGGKGREVNSPILPSFYNLTQPEQIISFDPEKAASLLEKEGFVKEEGQDFRVKTVIKQTSPPFTKNLSYGSKGEEVKRLQECLAQDPEVYPEGTVSGYFGKKTKEAVIRFQKKYARDILEPIGLTRGTGDVKAMTRKKLNELCVSSEREVIPLRITLSTVARFPLSDIAKILKQNWQKIGVETIIKEVSISDLETKVLKQRDFEALLFGASLGSLLDPFPFWHSSQKKYPGLNISGYDSKQADRFLEKAREEENLKDRQQALESFQNLLLKDVPAIFLVSPYYVYSLSSKVKGFQVQKITEPSKRFSGIENWYLKTKRIWKKR